MSTVAEFEPETFREVALLLGQINTSVSTIQDRITHLNFVDKDAYDKGQELVGIQIHELQKDIEELKRLRAEDIKKAEDKEVEANKERRQFKYGIYLAAAAAVFAAFSPSIAHLVGIA